MSYTASDLTAIRAAITKGELEVEFADRRVRYRSIDELLRAESHIIAELSQTTATRPKQTLGVAGKGF